MTVRVAEAVSRRCRSCDEPFRPEGSWQRLCWPCWRELRAQAEQPRTVVITPVDAALLKSAIALWHPDRHPPERADLCNRVTAALVEALHTVRKGERAA
jgi:hypothetical protein